MFARLRAFFVRKLARLVNEGQRAEIQRQNRQLMARMKSCGTGVGLWGEMFITGVESLELGNNVHIGKNAWIRAEGGVSIGDNTHISRNLVLYSVNHDYHGECIPYGQRLVKKPVVIGRNVWIGMNVCIAPGTVIGDGAIIGMGTTVAGEVPPLSIIGSAKWRLLGHRDEQHYRECEAAGAFGGANGIPFRVDRAPSESAESHDAVRD